MEKQIRSLLPGDFPWADRFLFLPTVGSTNDLLKQMAREGAPHGTIAAADRQTGGHGRLGRSFLSPEGVGIYMSVLLRPNCKPQQLMHLTCATAVAMCNAVEQAVGLRPGIKWTNDLVSSNRKLCGILTELGLSPAGTVDYAIIGIGINCCQTLADFPPEIRDMAGSLAMVTGRPVDRAKVAASMMTALAEMDRMLLADKAKIMQQYRADCITLGKEISVVRGDSIRHGTALDIDEDGALIVRYSTGETEAVNSGEVSIRGLYGYA